MANFFQRHLLIVLALTENLLVASSKVDLCYVYKNCKGKISSSRDTSSQDRALRNTFLNKLRQDSPNTSEAHVSSLKTLPRNPKTLTSVRDQITPTHGKTPDAGNGQNNEEKKSLSPQRFPYLRTFRPIISQSNGLQYDRRLVNPNDYTPKVNGGGLSFGDDAKVKVKKELDQTFTLIHPPPQRRSPGLQVGCRLNRCARDRFDAWVSRQNRHDRFVNVADADTSPYRTLQEAREYHLKENALNARKNTKTFRFGKKRKSAKTIGMDNWLWKPADQHYGWTSSMESDPPQSVDTTKLAADARPFNLKEFLDQDPRLARRFSRLPKDRPKFRYGKRIILKDRPRREMSKVREMSMTLQPFKVLYLT